MELTLCLGENKVLITWWKLHVFINRADMSIMSCTSPLTVHVGFGILAQLKSPPFLTFKGTNMEPRALTINSPLCQAAVRGSFPFFIGQASVPSCLQSCWVAWLETLGWGVGIPALVEQFVVAWSLLGEFHFICCRNDAFGWKCSQCGVTETLTWNHFWNLNKISGNTKQVPFQIRSADENKQLRWNLERQKRKGTSEWQHCNFFLILCEQSLWDSSHL